MKTGIHPKYVKATVTCACGHSWETMSTRETIKTDLCSNCHPFYTGEQRIVDTAGQVERFMRRMGNRNAEAVQQPIAAKRTSKNRANVAPPPQERRPAPAAPATDADANAESDQSAEVETAEV
jgi:large subunit ribosomal protein L31